MDRPAYKIRFVLVVRFLSNLFLLLQIVCCKLSNSQSVAVALLLSPCIISKVGGGLSDRRGLSRREMVFILLGRPAVRAFSDWIVPLFVAHEFLYT